MSNKITISATVNADIKKAWDYYTNPEHITKWNFADPSWHCPSASNDMKVGGKYAARMEAKDGSFGFDFEATYNEIVNGENFTYTMPNGRKVNVAFKEDGNQTDVDVTFDPEDQHPLEFQKNGWQAILNNYKQYTETN
ncbi:SRPBCC family protein [Danxiaibacter flavus]|uniref:SRPBCC family protein n=1 Tax=Danxiaibacter flavus TaxID=3049108 RepID=A0ABV3ZF34_9BACT|nr:SRPBCC family protein [Chitinophagaceae bacterium DXS]